MKESDPGQVVVRPQSALLGIAFQYEKEGLGETKQEDDVNDAEGEHVPHDHGVYHDNERTRQLDGAEIEVEKRLYVQYEDGTLYVNLPTKEYHVKPRSWNGKDQKGLFNDSISLFLVRVEHHQSSRNATQEQKVANDENHLGRCSFLKIQCYCEKCYFHQRNLSIYQISPKTVHSRVLYFLALLNNKPSQASLKQKSNLELANQITIRILSTNQNSIRTQM